MFLWNVLFCLYLSYGPALGLQLCYLVLEITDKRSILTLNCLSWDRTSKGFSRRISGKVERPQRIIVLKEMTTIRSKTYKIVCVVCRVVVNVCFVSMLVKVIFPGERSEECINETCLSMVHCISRSAFLNLQTGLLKLKLVDCSVLFYRGWKMDHVKRLMDTKLQKVKISFDRI